MCYTVAACCGTPAAYRSIRRSFALGAGREACPVISKEEQTMDLRLYYQKIRDMKATIPDEFPVVVSHETDDGGKEGSARKSRRALPRRC